MAQRLVWYSPFRSSASAPQRMVVAAAERAADALLAVLKEDTPASRLITEQLILVLGAASRDAWAGLRAQSGAMPAVAGQRSRLGALVDPLGIFRGSALVTNDARDKAALEAARDAGAMRFYCQSLWFFCAFGKQRLYFQCGGQMRARALGQRGAS